MIDIHAIHEQIREFILKTSYAAADEVSNDTLIFAQGIMDSMGFISIISFIEEVFSVEIDDNDLLESNFESIDAITAFVSRKLNTEALSA